MRKFPYQAGVANLFSELLLPDKEWLLIALIARFSPLSELVTSHPVKIKFFTIWSPPVTALADTD